MWFLVIDGSGERSTGVEVPRVPEFQRRGNPQQIHRPPIRSVLEKRLRGFQRRHWTQERGSDSAGATEGDRGIAVFGGGSVSRLCFLAVVPWRAPPHPPISNRIRSPRFPCLLRCGSLRCEAPARFLRWGFREAWGKVWRWEWKGSEVERRLDCGCWLLWLDLQGSVSFMEFRLSKEQFTGGSN